MIDGDVDRRHPIHAWLSCLVRDHTEQFDSAVPNAATSLALLFTPLVDPFHLGGVGWRCGRDVEKCNPTATPAPL